jgi:hypothetical protein
VRRQWMIGLTTSWPQYCADRRLCARREGQFSLGPGVPMSLFCVGPPAAVAFAHGDLAHLPAVLSRLSSAQSARRGPFRLRILKPTLGQVF